jgi:hypothetical protein
MLVIDKFIILGNGIVTPEIFFTVATENNFFIKYLNLNVKLEKQESLQLPGEVKAFYKD